MDEVIAYYILPDLLNIPAASNNGTSGSLRWILAPDAANRFPPATAPEGSEGVEDTCPFPNPFSFIWRSMHYVCDDDCHGVSDHQILASNRRNFANNNAQGVYK